MTNENKTERMAYLHMSNQSQQNETKAVRKINEINTWMEYHFEIPGVGTFLKPKVMKQHLNELAQIMEQDFEESNKIKELRAEILQQARHEADEIIRSAKEQIEKQDLIEQARNYAKQIADAAYKEANEIIEEAKQARHQMLIETYTTLDHVYTQTQKDLAQAAGELSEQAALKEQSVSHGRSRMHSELERITKQYAE